MKKGHGIRYMEYLEPVLGRFTYSSSQGLLIYKLDLVGVQEVMWEKGGAVKAGEYIFFYEKGKENH